MNKTVKVKGLATALAWLQPLVKSIADGKVKLAEGAILNVPDNSSFEFSPTANPEVTNIALGDSGYTLDVDRTALLGLLRINAREPVTFVDVGPDSVQTQLSVFHVTAIDDGGG